MADVPLPGPVAAYPAAPAQRSDEILVAFGPAGTQRRLTVLFRAILCVPHAIALYVLGIVIELLAVIGWFAALFTGRLPDWLAEFITDWLRWLARYLGYATLLTDRYPPFEFADADYPVRVATAPGRLNPLAVFFRLLLVIPAAIVGGLAVSGLSLAMIVVWVIVLVTGTMPQPLHQAIAAVIRYLVRYYGYFLLLTGTYPAGLFGDEPGGGWAPPPPAPVAGYGEPGNPPPGYGQPAYPPPGYGQPAFPPPGYGQPGPVALPPPAADPGAWRLVLPASARRLVGLFIGLGVLVLAGGGVLIGVLATSAGSAVVRANAVSQVSQSHDTLVSAMNTLQSQVSACGNDLTCVSRQDAKAGQAFSTFDQVLRAAPMPDAASSAAAASLDRVTTKIAAAFRQLSTAASAAQYQQIATSSGLQQELTQFDTDYQRLGIALGAVHG